MYETKKYLRTICTLIRVYLLFLQNLVLQQSQITEFEIAALSCGLLSQREFFLLFSINHDFFWKHTSVTYS